MKYSGTWLIQTPRGHVVVSALSACPYKAGSTRKRHGRVIDTKTKADS